jgi:hypothetical protein
LLETLEAGTFLSLAKVKGLEIVGTKIFRPVNAAMPIIHRHMRNISFFIKSEHEENASCFGSQFSSLTNNTSSMKRNGAKVDLAQQPEYLQ